MYVASCIRAHITYLENICSRGVVGRVLRLTRARKFETRSGFDPHQLHMFF